MLQQYFLKYNSSDRFTNLTDFCIRVNRNDLKGAFSSSVHREVPRGKRSDPSAAMRLGPRAGRQARGRRHARAQRRRQPAAGAAPRAARRRPPAPGEPACIGGPPYHLTLSSNFFLVSPTWRFPHDVFLITDGVTINNIYFVSAKTRKRRGAPPEISLCSFILGW